MKEFTPLVLNRKQQIQSNHLFILVIACLLVLAVAGCNNKEAGKIPIDEKRAAEQVIPVEQGIAYQNRFISARTELAGLLKDSTFLARKFNLANAESFNRDAIGLLLNQSGADGIKIYFGSDEKGQVKLVLVPVDKNGKDIITGLLSNTALHIPGISSAQAQTGGKVVENGQVCPPCEIGK